MTLTRLAVRSLALEIRAAPLGTALHLILTVVVGALPAASAWFAKLLLDQLALGSAANGRVVVLNAVAGAGAGALAALGGQVLAVVAEQNRVAANTVLEDRLFTKVTAMVGLRDLDHPAYHDRLALAQQSIDEVPGQVATVTANGVRTAVGAAGYLTVVLRIWPPLVALVLLAALLALVAQGWLARRHAAAVQAVTPSQRRRGVLQLMMLDPMAGRDIRLYGLGGLFRTRMMQALRDRNRTQLASTRRDAIVQGGLLLAGGVVLGVGTVAVANRVLAGAASVGDVAFLIAAVAGLQAALGGVVESFGSANRAMRLYAHYDALDREPVDLPRGTLVTPPLRQGIELRDVWFRYDASHPWLLRGVSLKIPAGATVGLVGLNGAGKSTLAKLLCRFYDPQSGSVLWDGVDLRDLDVDSLRQRIAAVYQDATTFDLTAREGIGIGDLPSMQDRPRIERAAKLAGLHGVISDLPRGYDTMLSSFLHDAGDSENVLLSGGQWQRLALARSLMRADADLLLLDEPSSGLDPIAEHDIRTMLRRIRSRRTTMMISHRLAALRDADMIVVLADGMIVERGPHADLVAAGGGYADMFALQAAGYAA